MDYTLREIDIMTANEKFEPWYVALPPKAVVPKLDINREFATDTARIVNRIIELEVPDLAETIRRKIGYGILCPCTSGC